MPASDDNRRQALTPVAELRQLVTKMDAQKTPHPEDVDRFRTLAVSTPAAWSWATVAMPSLRQQLIEKISNGASRASMLAELDILKKQLDYDTAPALERLLIDHILTVRLRVLYAENCYTSIVVNNSVSLRVGQYWDSVLAAAHARYLKAIVTLAKVRKLARNTPALQINIATEGGKQVNVQDTATGQQATAPTNGTPQPS